MMNKFNSFRCTKLGPVLFLIAKTFGKRGQTDKVLIGSGMLLETIRTLKSNLLICLVQSGFKLTKRFTMNRKKCREGLHPQQLPRLVKPGKLNRFSGKLLTKRMIRNNNSLITIIATRLKDNYIKRKVAEMSTMDVILITTNEFYRKIRL